MSTRLPAMGCATCLQPLNSFYDLNTGRLHHQHGTEPNPYHRPIAVPLDSMDATQWRCDWCGGPAPIWTYNVKSVMTLAVGPVDELINDYGTAWATCATCSVDVSQRRPPRTYGQPLDKLRQRLHRAVATTARGRCLAVSTGWRHETLAWKDLPDVRDRIARLLRSRDGIPGIDAVGRACLADGLDRASLTWIDPAFCNLISNSASALIPTEVTTSEIRARDGLLVWANAMHPIQGTCAVSWTTTATGWQLTWYRALGFDGGFLATKHLRDSVGWLLPTRFQHLAYGEVVDAGHPAATFIATLLMISHKVSETIEEAPEEKVAKQYQRRHRDVPLIRLVYIRGRRTTASSPAVTTTSTARKAPQYRTLVAEAEGGFFRHQAHGPGRTLRKTIFVESFWRGSEDLPIRPGTVVRVLGSARLAEPPAAASEAPS
jgi:hypothetical protein